MYLDLLAQGELLHTQHLQKPFAQLLAQVFGLAHATIHDTRQHPYCNVAGFIKHLQVDARFRFR